MIILLVEDNELLLELMNHKLKEAGHTVHAVSDGRKAIDVVMTNSVDLIICDLMVPIISGLTFLRLRNKFMIKKVPVIVFSGLKNAQAILEDLGVDFQFFLPKPLQIENLYSFLEESRLLILNNSGGQYRAN